MTGHNDTAKATEFSPGPNTIVSDGWAKISVDPVGRIRAAND